MTAKRLSLLSVVLFCLAICLSGSTAFASHLRGTSISWAPTGTTGTIQFTIQYSQRTSFGGCSGTGGACVLGGTVGLPFNFGDGSAGITVNATITSVNAAQDYLSAVGTVTHTYSAAGPYIAYFENSARVQTIKSGESQNLRMETLVNPFATTANPSPVASMPAIVTVPLQASTGFTVNATNPNGDKLGFRLSTASEMYGISSFSCVAQQPPGLSINNSGVVTWDTTQITAAGCGFSQPASGDLWTVQFMVEDMDINNNVISKIPVDLIIELIVSTEALPTITFSNPGPISVNPGTPLTFTISGADTAANSRITFNVAGLPIGASSTNINQALTPPVSSTFTWTPTTSQVGSYVVTYIATNDTFEQTLASVTVNVTNLLPPVTSCPVSLTAQYNTAVSIPVQVSDPQGDAITVAWSADGIAVHTDNVAASTSTTNLALSQTFTTLGSHTVSINATNTNNLSSSCSTPITVTAANQVITFGALPNLTYGAADTALSATSNSGLAVTYTASGSCSIVNGALHTTGTGACSVTASQAGSTNYNAAPQVTQSFQIAQRPLAVTAQDATRQYGFANPAFAGTITGIANNDSVTATYSSAATLTSAVGPYPIVPSPAGAALSNYTVTINNGTLTVSKSTGTLAALTLSPMNAAFGTSVTIAQLVPAGETGTVTFYSGATMLGTGAISNGLATLITTALPVGPDSITGQTSGDSNYSVVTSPALLDTVGKAAGTLVAPALSPANAAFGTSVTITQAVTPGETGTVTFYSGTTVLGTGTISNGSASLITTALPAGTDSITGQTSGDTNYAAATSPAVSDAVGKAAGALAAPTVSPMNTVFGASVTITQAVTPGEAGTVTFYSGATALGTGIIRDGFATLTTTGLPAGTDSITAQTSGDANYAAATSSAVSNTVGKAAGALAAPTVSPMNTVFGASVTITQAVTPGETGTVTFYSGATVLGTGIIRDGFAALTTTGLPAGTDSITAQSSGDANYAAATSPVVSDAIGKATGTLAPPMVSPMDAVFGSSVTITQPVTAGETGTVTFYSGTAMLGTGIISNGSASLTTTALPVGTDSITAQTSGDANYVAATSPAVADDVAKAASALAPLTVAPANGPYGAVVTLTQIVPSGETGTVTFYNGTTAIGTAAISKGVATLTTTALPSGSDSITAQTSGDSSYNPGTGAAVMDTVGAAPVLVTLTSSSTALTPTQPVTFTATLTSVGAAPSGTVQFYDGSTLLGTATVTGGVATLTTTLPAGSTNVITAQYPGSTISAASQGNSNVTVLVAPLDFGYTLSSGAVSTQTVTAGASAAYNLTVTPLYGGFPGVVNFTVTGLPPGATYTLSPATLPASSAGSAQVLTVQTAATILASASDSGFGSKLAPVLLGMLVLPLAGSRRMRKSGNRAARYGLFCLMLLLGAGAMASLTGCGAGNGVYHQGEQSYTLTVTANSASTSHSVIVTLNEQ